MNLKKIFLLNFTKQSDNLELAGRFIVSSYILFMTFTDKEYFEVIKKNETVKDAYEAIIQTCINLQKQTDCPEEDIANFLKFISKNWND